VDDQDSSRIERQFSGYIVAFYWMAIFVREAHPVTPRMGSLSGSGLNASSSPPSDPANVRAERSSLVQLGLNLFLAFSTELNPSFLTSTHTSHIMSVKTVSLKPFQDQKPGT
jgi:hypothetical protein